MNIAGQEALIFVLYFLAYVAYLACRPEGELLHWITPGGDPGGHNPPGEKDEGFGTYLAWRALSVLKKVHLVSVSPRR